MRDLERRALGNAGLTVSVLGPGAGRIGGPELGDADAGRLLGRSLDLGVKLPTQWPHRSPFGASAHQ